MCSTLLSVQSSKYPLTIWRTQFTALLGTLESVFRNMGLFLGLAVKSRVPVCHLLELLQAPAGPMQNVTTGSVFCTIKLLFPKLVPYILQLLEQSGRVSGTTTVTSGFHTFNIHSSHSCHYSKVQNPVTHNAQSCTRNIKFSCPQQKWAISLSIYCFQSNLYFVFTQLSASFNLQTITS